MTSIEQSLYLHYKSLLPEFDFKNQTRKTTFSSLLDSYDAFLFDAFGTLHNRNGYVYPSAREWYRLLRENNKEIRLVTNSATLPSEVLSKNMEDMGLPIPTKDIFTSGSLLKEIRDKHQFDDCYYFGRSEGIPYVIREGIKISENPKSKTVVVASRDTSGEKFQRAKEILSSQGALLVVLNPDACAPELDGSRTEVSGIQAHRLFLETHCRIEIVGKPFLTPFAKTLKTLPRGSRAIMIGDTLGTDVMGALSAQIDACLILGRNTPEDSFEKDCGILGVRPTYIL